MCQIKLSLCCCSMIISPALQRLAISGCVIMTDRCSSATEPQHWMSWSYLAVQNQPPIRGFFKCNFCKKLGIDNYFIIFLIINYIKHESR